jgi:zinc transport system substrate-binding protein
LPCLDGPGRRRAPDGLHGQLPAPVFHRAYRRRPGRGRVPGASRRRSGVLETGRRDNRRLPARGTDIAHSHGAGDEHAHAGTAFTTWLDPGQAILQAEAIKSALIKKRPQAQADFERNYAALESDLFALDTELKKILSNALGETLLASHPVYQYLARAYDLDLRSVLWEPGTFPSEAQWNELAGLAGKSSVRWMLWEDDPLDDTVARLEQMGIDSLVFAPCGNAPGEGDYLSVMQANLARLRRAF